MSQSLKNKAKKTLPNKPSALAICLSVLVACMLARGDSPSSHCDAHARKNKALFKTQDLFYIFMKYN